MFIACVKGLVAGSVSVAVASAFGVQLPGKRGLKAALTQAG